VLVGKVSLKVIRLRKWKQKGIECECMSLPTPPFVRRALDGWCVYFTLKSLNHSHVPVRTYMHGGLQQCRMRDFLPNRGILGPILAWNGHLYTPVCTRLTISHSFVPSGEYKDLANGCRVFIGEVNLPYGVLLHSLHLESVYSNDLLGQWSGCYPFKDLRSLYVAMSESMMYGLDCSGT
jgi:hypothetical protein